MMRMGISRRNSYITVASNLAILPSGTSLLYSKPVWEVYEGSQGRSAKDRRPINPFPGASLSTPRTPLPSLRRDRSGARAALSRVGYRPCATTLADRIQSQGENGYKDLDHNGMAVALHRQLPWAGRTVAIPGRESSCGSPALFRRPRKVRSSWRSGQFLAPAPMPNGLFIGRNSKGSYSDKIMDLPDTKPRESHYQVALL